MSSPDFATFVGTLTAAHQTWLTTPEGNNPTGDQFLNHYVGDETHPGGLLWQYEAWRNEHGYTRVRPWNGTELLGRTPTAGIPSPGLALAWVARTAPPAPAPAGPPFANVALADGTSTAGLQAAFGVGNTNALGAAIRTHWNSVRGFQTPWGDSEIQVEETAPYSHRFWGFMKWASMLRNRLLGIPVFGVPIVYDADGVPLTEMEYLDAAARWHSSWHRLLGSGTSACGLVTAGAWNNPFAPTLTTFGQFCGHIAPAEWQNGEFLRFHRDLLDKYDDWRRRMGMPKVARYKPLGLHFHPNPDLPETMVSSQGLQLSEDPATQLAEIKSVVRHFYSLEELARWADGDLHAAGHGSPDSADIAGLFTNNYSPRFMAWHRWIDYLWEVRQPRFDSLRLVASDGSPTTGALTLLNSGVMPPPVSPSNTLTGLTADGRGTLHVRYNIRPENWGRAINLTLTAEVYRNSSDMTPVAALTPATVAINAAAQGVDAAAVAIAFTGLDSDGDGAFARVTLPGAAIGFKNARIRIEGRLTTVGDIPGSNKLGGPADTIDYEQSFDTILVREVLPPVVSVLLNKSSFSVAEVGVTANGATAADFDNSFFVVLQDPAEAPPGYGPEQIFADPARTAVSGIFLDPALQPTVQVVDDLGTNVVGAVTLGMPDIYKEQPLLPDHVSQRVLFGYGATLNVASLNALLPNDGDIEYVRLRITARDRAGNTVSNVLSPRIKLFRDANPFMLDVLGQNPAWLSVDTRVFSVRHGESRFGSSVAAAGSANAFIAAVIDAFNGGAHNFDAIPADQGQSQLELAQSVNGENVYNFALARVRMRTDVAVPGVRTFFRLFTTALSNLSFTDTNYPTTAGVPLLGRAGGTAEIVSIPFFAAPRIETRLGMGGAQPMTAQPDPDNEQPFDPSPPGGETVRYFAAYLDINSNTPRYPAAPSGDGPFPAAECVSIRNILRGQHECMAAEVYFIPDPTEPNATPGTSDNLAQRNLLIVETANPGREATHTAQHSFDIVLPARREREPVRQALWQQRAALVTAMHSAKKPQPRKSTASASAATADTHAAATEAMAGVPAVAVLASSGAKTGDFDELLFLWTSLPRDARVELYLPSIDVEPLLALRRLRRAPDTVRAIDAHTLLLDVAGPVFLPIPYMGQERIAALLTVTLPDTLKAGQVHRIDVLQTRPATSAVVGGFQLMIPVTKALRIFQREARVLAVFEERLKLVPARDRWHPILSRQVDYLRARTIELAAEAVDECLEHDVDHPHEERPRRVRVILDKIRVLDVHGPLVHGSGRLALIARVHDSKTGLREQVQLPPTGAFLVSDEPGGEISVNREIFRGAIDEDMTVEIYSGEDEEPHEHKCVYRREFHGTPDNWIGEYRPSDQARDPENVGDWQLWYRVENV